MRILSYMKIKESLQKAKYILPIILLLLTIVPFAEAAPPNEETGPNTIFEAWYISPMIVEVSNNFEPNPGRIIYVEVWTFAIRDLDPPAGKAGLKDFELFAVSHTLIGYDSIEEKYFAETIVFGTLKYLDEVEDGNGGGYWVSSQEQSYRVSGGGSFTVKPTSGPDYTDWEKAVFKISATDVYGSKVTISGSYICASGPPTYYINLNIKLTGQVYEYNYDENKWVPTGRVETHTLKLKGYPQDYYYLPPYYLSSWAMHNELVYFPEYWPFAPWFWT